MSALAAPRRIVLEQLGHRLLEVLIVLVGVLLDIESLRRVAAPDELFLRRVEDLDRQLADLDRGGSNSSGSPPARTGAEAVELLLLVNPYLIGDLQVATALNPLQSFQCELRVHGPL